MRIWTLLVILFWAVACVLEPCSAQVLECGCYVSPDGTQFMVYLWDTRDSKKHYCLPLFIEFKREQAPFVQVLPSKSYDYGLPISFLGAWSGDGKRIAYTSCNRDFELSVCTADVSDLRKLKCYSGLNQRVVNFSLNSNGEWLAFLGIGDRLSIGRCLGSSSFTDTGLELALKPTGNQLLWAPSQRQIFALLTQHTAKAQVEVLVRLVVDNDSFQTIPLLSVSTAIDSVEGDGEEVLGLGEKLSMVGFVESKSGVRLVVHSRRFGEDKALLVAPTGQPTVEEIGSIEKGVPIEAGGNRILFRAPTKKHFLVEASADGISRRALPGIDADQLKLSTQGRLFAFQIIQEPLGLRIQEYSSGKWGVIATIQELDRIFEEVVRR